MNITIDTTGLIKVLIDMLMQYYSFYDSIITIYYSVFTSRFWLLLWYFLTIKQKLSTAFHPQTDGQTERQNITIEVDFRAFTNFE